MQRFSLYPLTLLYPRAPAVTQEDLCKMLLASYNALRSTASRMMPELAASHRPLAHALLVQDQNSSVLDLARRACVAVHAPLREC